MRVAKFDAAGNCLAIYEGDGDPPTLPGEAFTETNFPANVSPMALKRNGPGNVVERPRPAQAYR